jgi:hypothetical protein
MEVRDVKHFQDESSRMEVQDVKQFQVGSSRMGGSSMGESLPSGTLSQKDCLMLMIKALRSFETSVTIRTLCYPTTVASFFPSARSIYVFEPTGSIAWTFFKDGE